MVALPLPRTHSKRPIPMRLTKRDRAILRSIHTFDGMMSLKQIDRLFFSGRGGTWPRERMRMLVSRGFAANVDRRNAHRVPAGEVIYWLDKKGIEAVASLHGKAETELPWKKEPRWSLINHDLTVNDFRMNVAHAVKIYPTLSLDRWIPESEFWAFPDSVDYQEHDGTAHTRKVRPDGFFTISRAVPRQPQKTETFAFLVEIDMSTEDNPRFAREKVRPGVAYLRSRAYKERFGLRFGRWLVVTTGERRLAHMKTQTERSGGAGLFYFTTFAQVLPNTVLTEPVWRLAGSEKPTAIIPDALLVAG